MPKRQRVRYGIDRLNRLWLQELDEAGLPLGPRRELEGFFQTKRNQLFYRLTTVPKFESGLKIPRLIRLRGRWSLTQNHDLALTLREATSKREGERLVLKGVLLYAESDALGFAVTSRTKEGRATRTLRLEGKWEADPESRFIFHVEKQRGEADILRLGVTWEVDRQNRLTYRYRRRVLAGGPKKEQELSFRGVWDFSEEDRLTYRLDLNDHSVFRFRAALQSRSLLAREGKIRYQLGVGLTGRREVRTVTFFGKWKLNHDLSLDFELTGRGGNAQRLRFGATRRFPNQNEVSFLLEDERGRPIGAEVRFSKRDLGVELFLRIRRAQEEELVETGGRIPF